MAAAAEWAGRLPTHCETAPAAGAGGKPSGNVVWVQLL
jgi:hypothetical protein